MLNEKGYYRPTYDEIVAEKEQMARELFGDDIDTSEPSPLGKFIRITSYDLAKAYEDIEYVYYARFPNTATGTSLDRLCPYAGITRNPATPAQHTIRVFGEINFSFGIGELVVSSSDEVTFYNVNEHTILAPDSEGSETGYVDVIVECTEAGTVGNVRSITEIVNPIAEISRIEYVGLEELGEEEESDQDLRNRFTESISGAGSSNANSIRAAIQRVPGVISAIVISNNEDTADNAGRPPHSFECYVYGGEDKVQEIAEAIFEKAPIGIKSCSTATGDNKIETTVNDAGGYPHPVCYSKSAAVEVYLSIKYKKNLSFPDDGEAEIINLLVEYINGLGVGADVILSKLYEFIYFVNGVEEVTTLELSTDGVDYAVRNAAIESYQVAHVSAANISLEVAE